jgi:hypothetical protein
MQVVFLRRDRISRGTYTWPLWAGAAGCDTQKGVHVGNVVVRYDKTGVSAVFNLFPGYTLLNSHVYAGTDRFPLDRNGNPTVAPGQYYNIGPFNGPIYVIAHAVVCGSGEKRIAVPVVEEKAAVKLTVAPNPFRDQTEIIVSSGNDTKMVVEVHNMQGSRVAVLYDGMINAHETRAFTYQTVSRSVYQPFIVVVRTPSGTVSTKIIQAR